MTKKPYTPQALILIGVIGLIAIGLSYVIITNIGWAWYWILVGGICLVGWNDAWKNGPNK